MANRWIVEAKAFCGPDVNLLDQIVSILLSKIGLGNELANLPMDDTTNEVVVTKVDGLVV
jgi:hypothetical protein